MIRAETERQTLLNIEAVLNEIEAIAEEQGWSQLQVQCLKATVIVAALLALLK